MPASKTKGPAFGSPEWRKKHGLPVAKKISAKSKATAGKTRGALREAFVKQKNRKTLSERVAALEKKVR